MTQEEIIKACDALLRRLSAADPFDADVMHGILVDTVQILKVNIARGK